MYLNGLNCPSLRLFQFYEEIWEMFQLSDIIITKPGGMTVFEGVYMKKPFIFMNYIPGQEKENMDLLAKYGIGRFAETEQQLSEAIAYFKDQAEILNGKYPITVYDIRLPLKEALAQML
jgi:processive 1,2-diacylglycerol beta-glucosyltransferase